MGEGGRLVPAISRGVSGDARSGDVIGAGSLKIIAIETAAGATSAVEDVLRAHIGSSDIRSMGGGTWLVYTGADAGEIRDWLAPVAGGGALFVAEFEAWAGHGDAIDRAWLLRRGH
jgi:hypothetical protein